MVRTVLLSLIAIDVGLIIGRVLTFPAVWSVTGFTLTLTLLGLSLIVAATFVIWSAWKWNSDELGFTAPLGLVCGGILIAHMALEDFAPRVGEDARLTLVVMFVTFALWFVAGSRTGRGHSGAFTGAMSGCRVAIFSVLLAVTFGFAGTYFNLPSSAYVATWPEYAQSASSDPQAFAISNTFDAGTSHIFVALLLGTTLGAAGAFVRALQKGGSEEPGHA